MKVLTPLQEDFLGQFTLTSIRDSFFLTGGTALSAFYLQHRISEDMDFFTEEEGQVPRVLPVLQEISRELKGKLEIRQSFRSYLEVVLTKEKEILRCDFAMDSPFRLEKKIFRPEHGIYVDNILDISCNKLSALFDRGDPKDFVDIYFINKEVIPFEKLVGEAKKKHVGLDNYWLAISLAKVEDITILPRMLKPIELDELKRFFSNQAKKLMQKQ